MEFRSFSAQSKGIGLACTAAASTSAALPGQGATIRIVNEGPNAAFLSIGAGAQTATVPTGTALGACTAFPVGDVTLTIPADQVYNFSAICRATQTAQLNIYVGEGQ